jgi:acyl-CoA thioesterase FadM
MARVKIIFPEPALLTTLVDVRITDLNYGNHLGHDTLISLLHEARVRFFEHYGMKEWDASGLAALVADLAVSYRREVHYPQTLEISVALDDPGKGSCDLVYRVVDHSSGRLVALAKTCIVFIDPDTRKVALLPEGLRRLADGSPE